MEATSGVARLFKLGGHFIRCKIVGGHAKKQATKKRYHFITLGVQQSRSELLRTGGTSAVGGARTLGDPGLAPRENFEITVSVMLFPAF